MKLTLTAAPKSLTELMGEFDTCREVWLTLDGGASAFIGADRDCQHALSTGLVVLGVRQTNGLYLRGSGTINVTLNK